MRGHVPKWPGIVAAGSVRLHLSRFGMHLGFVARPTSTPEIEILLIARSALDHVLPVLVFVDVFMPGRSGREVLWDFHSGTALSVWIGEGGLHCLLVFALQAIPLLARCFGLHRRQSLWHT